MSQKSKLYTGSLGTIYDVEEVSMPDGFVREKRNTRLFGNMKSTSSSYMEGFTSYGQLPGVSDVLVMQRVGRATTLEITVAFNIAINGANNAVSETLVYSNDEIYYNTIRDAINTQLANTGIKAATIGNSVVIWYESQTNAVVELGINYVGVQQIAWSKRSVAHPTLHPLGAWSYNREAVLFTVVPTPEAVNENTDIENTQTLCQIWHVFYNEDGTIQEYRLKYNHWIGYRLWQKLRIQGIQENNCIHKVYVVDNINPFKGFNILFKDLMAVDPKAADANPAITLQAPDVYAMTNDGVLPVGAIQYCYRIYGQSGSASIISPYSNLVYLPFSKTTATSFDTVGAEAETLSGKSVKVRISSVNIDYERIEVIAIYRQTELAITGIEIIYDGQIENKTLEIIHSRKGQGTPISLNELFEDNKIWNIAKEIEIHENHLIAANLKGIAKSVNDFDSVVKQYNTSEQTYPGKFNPNPEEFKYLPGLFFNGLSTVPLRVHGGESDKWKDGNGIRVWYHIDKYVVDEEKQYIPYNNPTNLEKPHYGVDTVKTGELQRNLVPGKTQDGRINNLHYNNSYDGHSNPMMGAELASYQQGETYRLGIVFNKNGKDMPVKYIGDFLIPNYSEVCVTLNSKHEHSYFVPPIPATLENTFSIGSYKLYDSRQFNTAVRQTIHGVKLMFDIRVPNNVLQEYDGYKIVRAERKLADKTVFGQGVGTQVVQYFNHWKQDRELDGNRYGQGRLEGQYGVWPRLGYESEVSFNRMFIHSPDVVFNADEFFDTGNLKLRLIAELDAYRYAFIKEVYTHPNVEHDNAKKIFPKIAVLGIGRQSNITLLNKTEATVKTAFQVAPGAHVPGSAIDLDANFINEARGPIVATNGFSYTGQFALDSAQGILVNLTDPFTLTGGPSPTIKTGLFEFYRPATNQYGGKTEFALQNTDWVECSMLTPLSGNQYLQIVGGGDIYSNLVAFTQHSDAPRENRFRHPYEGSGFKWFPGSEYGTGIAMPCNAVGNLAFTHGQHYNGESYNWTAFPQHFYNPTFHAKTDSKRHVYLLEEPCENILYPGLIAVSRNKINGQRIDNWLQFPAFDFFEADLSLGEITHIISQGQTLWVVQENGIGVLSFDPYAVAQTADGASIQIVSGTGQKIKKLFYVSRRHGSQHQHYRVRGHDGTYVIDARNYEMLIFAEGGYEAIAKKRGYGRWFRDMLKNKVIKDQPLLYKGMHGYFDTEHDEVLIEIFKP